VSYPNTSKKLDVEHKDYPLVIDCFPRNSAMDVYRWLLNIKTKGDVTKQLKLQGKEVFEYWKEVRSYIKTTSYSLRLWKAIATLFIERCDWCVNYAGRRCTKSGQCLYTHSLRKSSQLFGITKREIRFINRNFSHTDEKAFQAFLKNVTHIIPKSSEKSHYSKVVMGIFNNLTKSGNVSSKINRGRFLGYYFGITKEDLESEILSSIVYLVRRYDYLPTKKLLNLCSRSLTNRLNGIMSHHSRRQGLINVMGGDDLQNYLGSVVSDTKSTEDTLIKGQLKDTALRLLREVDGELKVAIEILLGNQDDTFIDYLKSQEIIKSKRSWKSFYDGTDPVQLMEHVENFSGYSVKTALQNKMEVDSNNESDLLLIEDEEKPTKGDCKMSVETVIKESGMRRLKATRREEPQNKEKETRVMEEREIMEVEEEDESEDNFEITIPKVKCVICGYWIPWIKKEPKDCSPSYPGCPIHVFSWKRAFPIEQAAVQLINFLQEGDDVAIKEFVDTAPCISDIINHSVSMLMDAEEEEYDEPNGKDVYPALTHTDGTNGPEEDLGGKDTRSLIEEADEEDSQENDVMVVGTIDPIGK